jgi:hypothetical protein
VIDITDTEVIHKKYKFRAKIDGTKYSKEDKDILARIYTQLKEPSKAKPIPQIGKVSLSTYKSVKGYDSPQLDLLIQIDIKDKLIIDSVVFYPLTFKQFFPYLEIDEKLEEIRLNINNNISVISYKELYISEIVKEIYNQYAFLSRFSSKETPVIRANYIRNIDNR